MREMSDLTVQFGLRSNTNKIKFAVIELSDLNPYFKIMFKTKKKSKFKVGLNQCQFKSHFDLNQ